MNLGNRCRASITRGETARATSIDQNFMADGVQGSKPRNSKSLRADQSLMQKQVVSGWNKKHTASVVFILGKKNIEKLCCQPAPAWRSPYLQSAAINTAAAG